MVMGVLLLDNLEVEVSNEERIVREIE